MATSAKQSEANRQNSRQSTGPKTKPGKSCSRYNDKKHGLLTKTLEAVEVAFERKKDLEKLTDELYDEYLAKSPLEKILVERLISVTWRLRRIQLIDANEFETQFESHEQATMIDPENLNLIRRYETMLNRQFYLIIDRLEKLQSNRRAREEASKSPKETKLRPPKVKIRNEPICSENRDNFLRPNHLEKQEAPLDPRPRAQPP